MEILETHVAEYTWKITYRRTVLVHRIDRYLKYIKLLKVASKKQLK